MQIELTDAAFRHLANRCNSEHRIVKLAYDTEGCGCAVNGVVQLWEVGEILPNDRVALTEPVTLIYDQRQEVFFEDKLKLDYNTSSLTFSLKSDNQIYHPSLCLLDKTGGLTV